MIATLYMLALATNASAECAWLQWSKTILPSGEDAWSMVAAYTQQEGGKAACEESARARRSEPKEINRSARAFRFVYAFPTPLTRVARKRDERKATSASHRLNDLWKEEAS